MNTIGCFPCNAGLIAHLEKMPIETLSLNNHSFSINVSTKHDVLLKTKQTG